jgi:hypothetical protein
MGARVHPMSGAGRIKADGSDDDYLYEIKDANKSFTLKSDDLRFLYAEAVKQMRQPVMLVSFQHGDLTAVIQVVPTTSLSNWRDNK